MESMSGVWKEIAEVYFKASYYSRERTENTIIPSITGSLVGIRVR